MIRLLSKNNDNTILTEKQEKISALSSGKVDKNQNLTG